MSIARKTRKNQIRQWVVVRTDPGGQFTAQVMGVPELQSTGSTREQAIETIRTLISEWIASGQLVAIDVPKPNPLLHFTGHLDPNDPIEQEFVAELARLRHEDYERTIREDEQECSNSSSTPTT